MMSDEMIREYGDTRVAVAEKQAKIEILEAKLKDSISLNDFCKYLYLSSDERSVWVDSKYTDKVKAILKGEEQCE